MDEVLEVADVIAESGLEGAFTWLLRIVGLLALFAGVGLWLFTDVGLLVLPAVLMAVGVVVIVAPEVLFTLAELAG